MLESLTIFSKGGLILYQYTASPSLVGAADPVAHTRHALNTGWISKVLWDASSSNKTFHIDQGLSFSWKIQNDIVAVALYPDILFEGPRQYLKTWSQGLLDQTLKEYTLYQRSSSSKAAEKHQQAIRPDPAPFDRTFRVLLQQSKGEGTASAGANSSSPAAAFPTAADTPSSSGTKGTKTDSSNKSKNTKTGGKQKRSWHDGNAKVTEKAMAELDKSAAVATDDKAAAEQAKMDRMLQEARQAYLPDAAELLEEQQKEEEASKTDSTASWSSSITGLFQQLTGNKVLQSPDLDQPLADMEELLTSKNVAREIAHELCEACRSKLTGKRLNSLYRIPTAVQQAMETVLSRLLDQHRIDLLRQVLAKRASSRRPYVIAVMGINGIGKTTTLAKLAYYFQQHGCRPLLVAGDTFRSGAVEQLQVHAQCLEVPLFTQGYAKDPSAVATAAIQHATAPDNKNDVVLIDTAGRMQNNVPLMKALGKLVRENKPDCCLFVCEALVGHDGLDQFQMFRQATAGRIDGLILTKVDTVSDKVGAALTLTHQTGAPIVFIGTGQKYHHLKTLSVPEVMRNLFS